MEELLLFVIHWLASILWELLGDVLFQGLFDVGRRSLVEPFLAQTVANPLWAVPGLLIIGGAAGALFTLIFQMRLLPQIGLPGLSLMVMPMIGAWLMNRCGRMMPHNGRDAWYIATSAGGAALAFGLASARLILLPV